MRRMRWHLLFALAIVAIIVGGYFVWDRATQVSAAELQQIVQRDAVPFDVQAIPDEVLDQLATNLVVLVGESHFLREHRELVAELLRELHGRGFRQYLIEWTQAADWLLADFVNDGGLMPGWTPPHDIGGEAITAIRDFNRTIPESERIQVHGIDVHLPDYGGTESWVAVLALLTQQLPEPGPLTPFLQGDHDTYESHRILLEELGESLEAARSELTASWGEQWYSIVVEMVEVELMSAAVRAIRESDYDESVRQREAVIKLLADRRIGSSPGGALINMGATHAQKEQLWGTEIEWLGDYLVHTSPVTGGSVVVLNVAAANIISVPGSAIPDFDLAASPNNELLRVMNGIWPKQSVYLALDDPLLGKGRIPINVSGEMHVGALQRQFDAIILLPMAHRDFVGD